MMRILIADHHEDVLQALRSRFEVEPGMELMGDAVRSQELLILARGLPVDLILLDGELPGMPLDELIADLHAIQPCPKVVVMGSSPELGRGYLKAGADAFVSKGDQPEWLFQTLHKYDYRFNKERNHK